jgi:NADH-quinone oxidoreductase subunit K
MNNEIPLLLFLWAGACLFAIGFSMLILKRNAIFVLMGIELMLNAANLNLIAFSRQDTSNQGLLFGIFVLVVGVCEMAVALALVIQAYRQFQHIDLGRFKSRN